MSSTEEGGPQSSETTSTTANGRPASAGAQANTEAAVATTKTTQQAMPETGGTGGDLKSSSTAAAAVADTPTPRTTAAEATLAKTDTAPDASPSLTGPTRTDTTTALQQASAPLPNTSSSSPPPPPAQPSSTPQTTQTSAITPLHEAISSTAAEEEIKGLTIDFVLLFTSGARYSLKLDSKYLTKRNVDVQNKDPYNLTVYEVKELILRDWREEWESKPSNPTNIRLISMGRLLDDKGVLKDQRLNVGQPNVLHMTIRPLEFIEEDDGRAAKGSFSGTRDGRQERSPRCRCLVM